MAWGQKEGYLAAISATAPLVASLLPVASCTGICAACGGGCVSLVLGAVIVTKGAITAHKKHRRTEADSTPSYNKEITK